MTIGVSPARAGMDRWKRIRTCWGLRFPRTRGDGPAHDCAGSGSGLFPPHARGWTVGNGEHPVAPGVSPARAGMDRRRYTTHRSSVCFPRTRGDGPSLATMFLIPDAFPPHARGWTPVSPAPPRRCLVSPARAGMDPPPWTSVPGTRCFPRTRGDGPESPGANPDRIRFPPHARGWTVVHKT